MSRRLEVSLHDLPVGVLAETPEGDAELRFFETYRTLAPRPVLGQKFEDDLERTYRSRRGQRLPDFFANLVPEGALRDLIVEAAELEVDDDLSLLAFVGRDLPGAVVVRAAAEEEASWLTETAPEPARADDGETTTRESLRFSLAGVQLKFSMLREGEKLTLPAANQTGEWIVKFDSHRFSQLPENELSMLEWARHAGFEVPECRLHDIEDVIGFPRHHAPRGARVLALRRYDRRPEGRTHQEDFAQAVGLPPSKKYDQITYEVMARLVRRFIDEEAVDEFIRRLVFMVASGNGDAHLKNWSLIYPDKVRARWSPLYDQVATIAWKEPLRELALKLAGVKAFHRIDRTSFERFAEKAETESQRVFDRVDETLERLHGAWHDIGADLPLPAAHRAALEAHWRKVPLLQDSGPLC